MQLTCKQILDNLPKAKVPKSGVILVGLDGNHCGIIDDSGNKFIHSNPRRRVVTDTPLTLAYQFFKNGFTYKEYPTEKFVNEVIGETLLEIE